MATSPIRSLPRNPSLESLKKQAKALLRAHRAGDAEAQARVGAAHPKPGAFSSLRDAQLTVAREYGEAGWDELRLAVEAANLAARPRAERVAAFLDDACLDYGDGDRPFRRRRAQRLLDEDPTIAREDAFTAAAAGDVEALRGRLEAEPDAARRTGGPRRWPALMYLTYARLPEPRGDAVAAARLLLDAGADPDAHAMLFEKYRFSALTGAMGEGEAGLENQPLHPQARALAELLLERGADPNETQGLYDTHFTDSCDVWLELLVAHGLGPQAPFDEAATVGTLDYLLGQAVKEGRLDRVTRLLELGADPDGRDYYERRPHWENALRQGRREIAERLRAGGAEAVELSSDSRFRALCMAADEHGAREMLAGDPSLVDDEGLVHDAVRHGSDVAVRLVFALGGSVEAKGPHFSETPAHQAAMLGRDAIVEHLLELGALLDGRDPTFGGTLVGWANQGGHLALRDRLLDRTDDVFDLAAFGRTAQLRARLEAAPELARARIDDAETPLHSLHVAGDAGAATIDLLLEHGADLDAAAADGSTPLSAALGRGEEDVAELLRERGARERGPS